MQQPDTREGSPYSLAEIARITFIRVSNERPAFVIGQAARIALASQQGKFPDSPRTLGDALLANTEEVLTVFQTAVDVHKRRSLGPPTLNDTKQIIFADFGTADVLTQLPPDSLQQLIDQCDELSKETSLTRGERETRARQFALSLFPPNMRQQIDEQLSEVSRNSKLHYSTSLFDLLRVAPRIQPPKTNR